MGAAVLGAWAEGAFLLTLFAFAHALQRYAMDRARGAIRALAELAPRTARFRRNGTDVDVAVETVRVDETLTCVALLFAGAFLESSIARAHRIRVEDLIDHYDTSLAVPVFFLGLSVLCGIGPGLGEGWRTLRRGRVSWLLVASVVILITFCVGHFVEAGAGSLVMSAVLNLRARRLAAADKARHNGPL